MKELSIAILLLQRNNLMGRREKVIEKLKNDHIEFKEIVMVLRYSKTHRSRPPSVLDRIRPIKRKDVC